MRKKFRAASELYQPWPYFYWYARCKTFLDPSYPQVVEILKGETMPLLDLGCGMGLLCASLRQGGYLGPVTGIDTDGEKIALARTVLPASNAEFFVGDAREMPEHQGNVVMLDVLHYFTDEEQQALLAKVASRVAPGGMAVIRMALSENNLRYALTLVEEWFVDRVKWIPKGGWNFPTMEEVIRPFRAAGFQEEVTPMWGLTPFNSYLFVFRRPGIDK